MDYEKMSAKEFADKLGVAWKIPQIYESREERANFYEFLGFLAAGRCFIEARIPVKKIEDFREIIMLVSPLIDYYPSYHDRGFYIDNSKWSWCLDLRVSEYFDIRFPGRAWGTKFCLYLIRHGFRIGRWNSIDEILKNVPKTYRKVFMEGANS